jgi:hypothetical protein
MIRLTTIIVVSNVVSFALMANGSLRHENPIVPSVACFARGQAWAGRLRKSGPGRLFSNPSAFVLESEPN